VTEGSRSVEIFKGMFHCVCRKSRYSVFWNLSKINISWYPHESTVQFPEAPNRVCGWIFVCAVHRYCCL